MILPVDPDPNHGGTSDHIIHYKIFVNQCAKIRTVKGLVEYTLQSA